MYVFIPTENENKCRNVSFGRRFFPAEVIHMQFIYFLVFILYYVSIP